MHFGRTQQQIPDALILPEDRARTQSFLRYRESLNGPTPKGNRIYIGAPMWGCHEWKGVLYPTQLSPRKFLRAYGQSFKTVECNATFYKSPSPNLVSQWYHEVPADFRFCPKLPKSISHSKTPWLEKQSIDSYCQSIKMLREKLAATFIQFPDYVSTRNWDDVKRFLDLLPRDLPWSIELRHESWFEDHMIHDRVINDLYKRGISVVITDTPGRRDVLHFSLCQPKVIIRFLGQFPSKSDTIRLKSWAERITLWQQRGVNEIYLFIHQAKNISIPDSIHLMERLLWEREHVNLN